MTDWGELYRDHLRAVTALVTGLDDAALATTVPATPAWTVHDVLAHLAGVASDNVTGRTDDAPSPTWTARHVGERAVLPVADLVAELESHVDAIAAGLPGTVAPGVVWDVAVHHADLHEALGRGALPERLWAPVLAALVPGRAEGLVGPDAPVTPYELFRAVFSRRSQAQVRAWDAGLDDDAVAALGVFGPRDDDQPVPA